MSPELIQAIELAENGDKKAQTSLARYFLQHSVDAPYIQKSIEWLTQLADDDLAEAQLLLGMQYLLGKNVEKDQSRAAEQLFAAAKGGSADAQNAYGLLCREGIGCQKSDHEAFSWFKAAANQGHSDAEFHVAGYYQFGTVVERDERLALNYYKKSAASKLQFSVVHSPVVQDKASWAESLSPAEQLLLAEYLMHESVLPEQFTEFAVTQRFTEMLEEVKHVVQSHSDAKEKYVLSLFSDADSLRTLEPDQKDFLRRFVFRNADPDFRLSNFAPVFLKALCSNDLKFFRAFARECDKDAPSYRDITEKAKYFFVEYWIHTPGGTSLCFLTDEALAEFYQGVTEESYSEDAIAKTRRRFRLLTPSLRIGRVDPKTIRHLRNIFKRLVSKG